MKSPCTRVDAQPCSEIADQAPLTAGSVYLVLVAHPSVAHPSTEQRIVKIQRMDHPASLEHYDDGSDEIRRRLDRMPIPDVRPPTHSVMTVLVRRGPCIIGPGEAGWLMAWRYANHMKSLYSGEIILVTEPGWIDGRTHSAD
jgi:hypothetical protein